MNTTTQAPLTLRELGERRSALEGRARIIRARLLRTVDALDHRRHQVQEIVHHGRRLVVPVVGTVLGALVLAAGAALAIRALVGRRRERTLARRLSRLTGPLRTWSRRPPFWRDAARKLSLSVLTIVVSELAKRSAKAVIDGRVLAFVPASAVGEPKALPEPEPHS